MTEITGTATAATAASALVPRDAVEKTLGHDEFLKLLVAQLRNQDPLKPQDSTQFVAELAQFSSLEQTMGINDRLDQLLVQGQGQANTDVAALVGTTATVRGSWVSLAADGEPVPVAFTLDGPATTTVTIRSSNGTVRTLDLGPQRAGLVQVAWDGRDEQGNRLPIGSYEVSVEAKNEQRAVRVSQEASGLVTAVSFDQGYPVLHLDNGVSVPVSDLLRVDGSAPLP